MLLSLWPKEGISKLVDILRVVADITVYAKWEEDTIVEEVSAWLLSLVL